METTVTQQITTNNLLLIYAHNQFLCTDQQQVLFSTDYLPSLANYQHKVIQLGQWNNATIELVIIQHNSAPPIANTHWQALRPLMLQTDAATFKMLGFASQIASWVTDHQFCSRCATPMQQDQTQYRMHCPHCGFFAYPRLNPCMIVLVTRGDEILLARSPHFAPNMYSTLAGFVEVGESVEQCVHREVFEEVGIQINKLHYIASQNWPYPYSLMLGFHASYEAGEINLQEEEIEDAQWFPLTKLPQLPPQQAISRYLIELYKAERLATPQPTFPH